MGQLAGKVAKVAGAGQGVGKGIATAYVKQGAAVFLASEGGHYLTGETLNVNGGLYMRP